MTNQPILPIIFNNFLSFDNVFFRRLLIPDWVIFAIDAYHGRVEKYSVAQSQDVLRQALIEKNNGKTYLDYKDIRDGKCQGLFTLIETILSKTVVEGLQGDEYFNALAEMRNVAEGDSPVFVVEDNSVFVVSEAADGTQGIRRQRLGGSTETTIPTSLKTVRIYEEMNRVLSGRVDFNQFITKVAESFKQKLLNDMYTLWSGATADQMGGTVYFPVAGNYDEDTLLDLIAHVEASAGGQKATIVGTKKALRPLKESILSDGAKEEWHKLGYVGTFFGTPVVAAPQRHKKFFDHNWFVFDEEYDWVIDFLGVRAFYNNIINLEGIDALLKKTPKKIEKELATLTNGQKRTVAYRAMEMIRNKEIDSLSVIEVLEKGLGIALVER